MSTYVYANSTSTHHSADASEANQDSALLLPFRRGERFPPCIGTAADQTIFSETQLYGKRAIVLAVGAQADISLWSQRFFDACKILHQRHVSSVIITDTDSHAIASEYKNNNTSAFLVNGGSFLSQCGIAPGAAAIILLDRSLKVTAIQTTDILNDLQSWLDDDTDDHFGAAVLKSLHAFPAIGDHAAGWFGMCGDRSFASSEDQYGRP